MNLSKQHFFVTLGLPEIFRPRRLSASGDIQREVQYSPQEADHLARVPTEGIAADLTGQPSKSGGNAAAGFRLRAVCNRLCRTGARGGGESRLLLGGKRRDTQ